MEQKQELEKRKVTVSKYVVPYSAYGQWDQICPQDRYHVVTAAEAPPGLPNQLLAKLVQVVLMSSGDTQQNRTVYVVNMIRYEKKISALDQEPLIVVFDHDKETTTAAFIHHGGWDSRTTKLDNETLLALENSGLTAYFPYVGIPTTPSGDLADLKGHPQGYAFWNVVKEFGA